MKFTVEATISCQSGSIASAYDFELPEDRRAAYKVAKAEWQKRPACPETRQGIVRITTSVGGRVGGGFDFLAGGVGNFELVKCTDDVPGWQNVSGLIVCPACIEDGLAAGLLLPKPPKSEDSQEPGPASEESSP